MKSILYSKKRKVVGVMDKIWNEYEMIQINKKLEKVQLEDQITPNIEKRKTYKKLQDN